MALPESKLLADKNKRIAIIYSVDELFVYIIKICHGDQSYYVGKNNQADKFGNMEEAVNICRTYDAQEVYLALSNTYQETDPNTDTPYNPTPRFDYQRIL